MKQAQPRKSAVKAAVTPKPLPVGSPMFYSAGNDVGLQPIVPPGQKLYTRAEAKAAVDHRFTISAKEGITAQEPYVKWWLCEPEPGQWDFSYFDLHAQAAKNAGIRWLPFLIAGPAYSTPPWFKKSEQSVFARCLEHHEETATQSIWNPNLRPRVAEFLRRFADHFDGKLIESLLFGISGDFGETLYTVAGNGWTYLDSPYHFHAGYWCGDDYAVADFRSAMKRKYTSIQRLNAAWTAKYTDFELVKPFLPKQAPNRRARLDLQRWYTGAMTEYMAFWLKEARKVFPKTRLMACVGGNGDSMLGADFTAQAEAAARYGAGLRITNEASNYNMNYMLTRQVATSCRFYGTFYGFEPAGGVNTEAISARIYNATASGADELFTYDPEPEGERGAKYREMRKYLVKREPSVDVAYFLNRTSADLGLSRSYWQSGTALRNATDFDVVDERLIAQGVLKRKRVLCWLDGHVVEQSTAAQIEKWVNAGGLLLVQTSSAAETVEGTPLSWIQRPIVRNAPGFTNYKIDIGNGVSESGLVGPWHDIERGGGFTPGDDSFRWSTTGSQIELPMPSKNDGVTVAVKVVAQDPRDHDEALLVDYKVVARPDKAGEQILTFQMSAADIRGRKTILLSFGGKTRRGSEEDARQLGLGVSWVAVGLSSVPVTELSKASLLGFTSGLKIEDIVKEPYTRRVGRGAVVVVPKGNLDIEQIAELLIYHPERFVPGAKAPYPMAECSEVVHVTRFTNGSVLLLNYNNAESQVRYGGKSITMAPYSIAQI